jgi:hypothetical protein
MLFLGCLSILQCWFLPGLTLLILNKNINLKDKLILSLPLSISLNYLIVFLLIYLNIHGASLFLLIIFFELIIICNFLYRENLIEKIINQLSDSSTYIKNYYYKKNFLDVIIQIIFLVYLFIAINNIGEVIQLGDPMVMWNKWSLFLANNELPKNTSEYPQAIPALLSITHILTQNQSIEFFQRSLFLIYPLWFFLIFLRSAELIKEYQIHIKLSLIFTSLITLSVFRHMVLYAGVVDPILIMLASSAGYVILLTRNIKIKNFDIIIYSLIISATGLTKQTGLLLCSLFPLWYLIFNKKNIKNFLLFGVLIFLITTPWYFYKLYTYFFIGDDQSSIIALASFIDGSFSFRVKRGLALLFSDFSLIILFLIIVGLKNNFLKILFFSFVLPYFLIWSYFFGNDARNFALAIPGLGIILGFAIYELFNSNIFAYIRTKIKTFNFIITISFILFFLFTILAKRSEEVLETKSLEQQKLRGDIQINNFLYWLLDEVKIKKIYIIDYDFLYLPDINKNFLYTNCKALIQKIENKEIFFNEYIFINLDKNSICSKKELNFFYNEIDSKGIKEVYKIKNYKLLKL